LNEGCENRFDTGMEPKYPKADVAE